METDSVKKTENKIEDEAQLKQFDKPKIKQYAKTVIDNYIAMLNKKIDENNSLINKLKQEIRDKKSP
jgi:ribosomal protein S17E